MYTANYCEENIYLLAQELNKKPDLSRDAFVVFISNPTRTAFLFNQKASQNVGGYVVWDYHVILVTVGKRSNINEELETLVWDFDTRLGSPCAFNDYIRGTFPVNLELESDTSLRNLRSMFRVVHANEYLDQFASDRSHMLSTQPGTSGTRTYIAPPPPYPAISGNLAKTNGVTNNLFSSFVLMDSEAVGEPAGRFGRVMHADEFYSLDWLTTERDTIDSQIVTSG